MSWRDYKNKKNKNILETRDEALNNKQMKKQEPQNVDTSTMTNQDRIRYMFSNSSMWNQVQAQTINNLQQNKLKNNTAFTGNRYIRPYDITKNTQNKENSFMLNQESFDNIKKSISDITAYNSPNYGKGNIDLNKRPVVQNDDGSISTVRSMSFYDENEGKEILIPTVVNGKIVSDNEAINHYYNTGEYLGKFDTVEEANSYAEQLHKEQEKRYKSFEVKDILKYNQENKKEEDQKRKEDFKNQLLKYNSEEAEKSNEIIKNGNIQEKTVEYGKEIGRSLLTGAVESVGNATSMLYNLPTKLGNAIGLKTVQQENARQGLGISPEDFTNNWKEVVDIENQRTAELDSGLQTASRWSRTIGEMIPAILVGQGMAVGETAVATQKSASAISSFLSALNSASSTYNETLNEEQNNYLKAGLKATLYGIATHQIEGITGGNILNKFGSLDDLAVGAISKTARNELQKKIGAIAYGVFGETLEENVENWVDHLIDYAFGDADDITLESLLEEAKQTSIDTSAVTLILQGIGLGGGTYNDVKMYEANQAIDNANYLTDKQKNEFKNKIEQEQNPYLARELLTGAIQEKIKSVDINQNLDYNINQGNKDTSVQNITVAPYYNTPITNENFDEVKGQVETDFKNKAEIITNLFGGKVSGIQTNIGGYTFQEGETAGQMVNELSYTFELQDVDETQADLIASLMGDLGYEQQESVISSNYLGTDSTEANSVETVINFNDINGVKEALEKVGITDYTIDTNNNQVKIYSDSLTDDVIASAKALSQELGGNYNGAEWNKTNSRFLDKETRGRIYQEWLKNNSREQEGELYKNVSEAYRKLTGEEINNNIPLDTQQKLPENKLPETIVQNNNISFVENPNYNKYHTKTLDEKVRLRSGSTLTKFVVAYDNGNYYGILNNDYGNYTILEVVDANDIEAITNLKEKFDDVGEFLNANRYGKNINGMSNETSNTRGSDKSNNNDITKQQSWTEFVDSILDKQRRINRGGNSQESIGNQGTNIAENSQNEGSFSLEENEFSDNEDMSDEKVAEILSKPYSKKEAKTRLRAIAMREVVDKGYIYENLDLQAKDTKNRTLQSKYHNMLHSYAQAQYTIAKGHNDYGDRGIYEIRADIPEADQQEFNEYAYHYLNIDRMSLESKAKQKLEALNKQLGEANNKLKESYDIDRTKQKELIKSLKREIKYLENVKNKPVFGDSITAEMSEKRVKELEQAHPEFKKYLDEVYKYLDGNVKYMVDHGVISQETAEYFKELYPHYVPIDRVDDLGRAINVPLDTNKTGINNPIHKATGGNSNIQPLFETIANRTKQTYMASNRNDLGNALYERLSELTTLESNEDLETELENLIDSEGTFGTVENVLDKQKDSLPTFTIFQNGKKVTFQINNDIYNSLREMPNLYKEINDSKGGEVLQTLSGWRRNIITEYNPFFMVTNAIKDGQDVLMNSQHPAQTYAKLPEAYAQIKNNGKWNQEYMANGGYSDTLFQNNEFKSLKADEFFGKKALNAISNANNFIELAPRLAEYIASREAGASIETAMLDSARVTTNFSAGGDTVKLLNKNGFTFLNANIQGLAQQVRNVREANAKGLKGWTNLAIKSVIAGLPAILLNNLIWKDDDEYEDLADYVKDNYYVICKIPKELRGFFGGNNFLRIPKGRTVSAIQKIVSNAGEYITNDKKISIDNILDDLIKDGAFAWESVGIADPRKK